MRGFRRRKRLRNSRLLAGESLESRSMLHAGAMLSGSVFFDVNDNGQRDTAEVGVPGVVVTLSDNTDAADRTAITNDNGTYTFDELLPGTYQVSKRQSSAVLNGQDMTSFAGAVAADNQFTNVVISDDQVVTGLNFGEEGIRVDFINITWFLASSPPADDMIRETVARAEDIAGETDLAAEIRAGAGVGDDPDQNTDVNTAPIASANVYSVVENNTLTIPVATGVLANDLDSNGDALTASVATQPTNGTLTFNANGSFTYVPNTDFTGSDTFTYTANDGELTSGPATVTINITAADNPNQLFGAVTQGNFTDSDLLGTRTDLVSGAPAITANHVDGDLDYSAHSNPPTYGDHHGFDPDGVDVNPGITPRPTGVYTEEQPDEDLIHNLEHGHVWISYNPSLISADDIASLQELVIDGSPNANGGGVGVILTPRAANTKAIALVSWAHLLELDSYNAETIRNFVETNRGHAPEGFITP